MWKLDASIKKAEQLLLDLNYEAVEMAYNKYPDSSTGLVKES